MGSLEKTRSAVVAGHICIDILPDFGRTADQPLPSLLRPGALVQTGALRFSGGGPVSNAGSALHRLGVPVTLIAKTGEDPLAAILRQTVNQQSPGLADSLKADPQSDTSYSIILSNRATDRIFLHCTGANDTFGPEDIDFSLVRRAALFHFGYPPVLRRMYRDGGRDFAQVMRSAKEAGATTSLDMCLPDPSAESGRTDWRPIYKAVLPHVDIFLPSFDELLYTLRPDVFRRMAGGGDLTARATPDLVQDLGRELLDLGVKAAMIKMGDRGAYLRTATKDALQAMGRAGPHPEETWAGRERWIPCFKVNVVGTTGSGDATIAGFLAGLLRGCPVEQALQMAVAVGACNVEAADSLSGLRTWEETRERIVAGWPQLPLALNSPDWEWDPSGGVWIGPLDDLR